jgi:hypothetical protein
MKQNIFKRSVLLAIVLILTLQPTATFCKKSSFGRYFKKHPMITGLTAVTATFALAYFVKQYFFTKKINEGTFVDTSNEKIEDNSPELIKEGKETKDEKKTSSLMSNFLGLFTRLFGFDKKVDQEDVQKDVEFAKKINDKNGSDTLRKNSDNDKKKIETNNLYPSLNKANSDKLNEKTDSNISDETFKKSKEISQNNFNNENLQHTPSVDETFNNLTPNSENKNENKSQDNSTNSSLYILILNNNPNAQKTMDANINLNKNLENTNQNVLNNPITKPNTVIINPNMDNPNTNSIYPNLNTNLEN